LNDAETGNRHHSNESVNERNTTNILKVKTIQSNRSNRYLKLAKNPVISSTSLENIKASSTHSPSIQEAHLETEKIRKHFFDRANKHKSFDATVLHDIHVNSYNNNTSNKSQKSKIVIQYEKPSASSLVKNILRSSGLLNSNEDNDKSLSKEHHSSAWLLDHNNVQNLENFTKSGDVYPLHGTTISNIDTANVKKNNLDRSNIDLTSTLNNEEQLQRDYLVNLLKELQSDSKNQDGSIDDEQNDLQNKLKTSKRSKSEATLNVNLINTSYTNANLSKELTENNKKQKKKSNYLGISNQPVNTSNCNLNIDAAYRRKRFSIRSLFKRSSLNKSQSSKKTSFGEASNYSLNKSSSNSLGTVHNSKTAKHSIATIDTRVMNNLKALSDLNIDKPSSSNNISINKNVSDLKQTSHRNANTLYSDSVENKTQSTNNLMNNEKVNLSSRSNSNQHDDDIDKVFNEYYAQKGYDCQTDNNEESFDATHTIKARKHFKSIFGFLFKNSKNRRNSGESFSPISSTRRKKPFSDYPFQEETSCGQDVKPNSDENDILKSSFDIFALEKKINKKGSCETLYVDAGNVIKNYKKFNCFEKNDHRVSVCTMKSLIPNAYSLFSNNNSGPKENKHNKIDLNGYIDVSFEKLQQRLNGHILSISMKNFRVEPLIEINHIKARLSYLKIQLINETSSLPNTNPKKNRFLAKIKNYKSKKCKFDKNLKKFSKPIDVELIEEHFFDITDEATNIQIKKISQLNVRDEPRDNVSTKKEQENPPKRHIYLFLLSLEAHSYLPISRRLLSSTFRKNKRIFRGKCQVYENFISSTEFTKRFILNEI
jgi:hypothetical protein